MHPGRHDKEGDRMSFPERTSLSELADQLLFGKCYTGPDAARAIAAHVEGQHGFWDFEERKRLAALERERHTAMLNKLVLISGGNAPRCLPPESRPAGDSAAHLRSA